MMIVCSMTRKNFPWHQIPLSKNVFVELEAGHAFDRAFFTAEEYTTNPDHPVDIGNSYYGKMMLRLLF